MRKGKAKNSKLLPNSFRIISSCIKTVSTNASTVVRSAGASVAASISSAADDCKEQVLWAGFDKLDLGPTVYRRVLLLGYLKGFQVFDVEDASNLSELVSRRDGPVSFLQVLPAPANCEGAEKYKSLHPILVVVGGDEDARVTALPNAGQGPVRYGSSESSFGSYFEAPTTVRFYSMKSNEYVKVVDFKSAVLMVRCSPRVVAIGLEEQIYCFDTLTLEMKFIVMTYPVPRVGEQGEFGIKTGYGPMALGPRWLSYPPNRPFLANMGRVSPKNLASSVSPSTSPGSGALMARYAVESSKHLASGILNLGDMGYKKISKYYPELLPDGHSSPGWKTGKLAASDSENAGWIVVKDLVSSEVISQFRAHTSPISALCFDPSGTLLVTASVHGNNINIFRIMPSHTCAGSGSSDWRTSYVHLYKLHRGLTTAVIQDICFSQYSQWIAVVSSKGTCHIFVLSPFGGDDNFQTLNTHGQGASPFLTSTSPWWSTSSFSINEQNYLPPSPCTLSVVSRIKCSDSGLLNSVSNAAASMVGKIWVPSGAVAAVFHNSNPSTQSSNSNGSSMEHILVYTPSGFLVQHEIQLSMGLELSESNQQNDELRMKVEPKQWWDVSRRLDNLEREECIPGIIYGKNNNDEDATKMFFSDNASAGENKLVRSDTLKSQDKSHWYLSNAEVHINSCRLPIWKKSKIHFHVMQSQKAECDIGGEFEIERISSHEVEIRRKNLLPAFEHFPDAICDIERSITSEAISSSASPDSCQSREVINEASIINHSKPSSFSSTESSEGGSSRRIENLLDLDHMNIDRSPILTSHSAGDSTPEREERPSTSEHTSGVNIVSNKTTMSRSCSTGYEVPPLYVDNTNSAAGILMPSETQKPVNFRQFFKEGYYSDHNISDHSDPTEVLTDEVDTGGNNTQEEKPDEDGWIGGMFDFSEEG